MAHSNEPTPPLVGEFEVIAGADPADPERKVKARVKHNGLLVWIIPVPDDPTGTQYTVRFIS